MQKSVNGVMVDMSEDEIKELQSLQEPVVEMSEDEIKAKEAQDKLNLKYHSIESYIYSHYSERKQAQDDKWVSAYTTKLKASGIKDLEVQIVKMVGSILKGASLADILKDTPDEVKPMFEKLVKVATRTEWAELCVKEGYKAIQENRDPDYAEFPKL